MNRIITILFIAIFFQKAVAQSPQAIPYQAVVRNASGNIISNQAVKLRFSMHDSLATGTVVYKEIHTISTNAQGLVNVNIGKGTLISGSFSGINWGKNNKFIQVELDPLNNNNYTDLGTTQMMSVPYALYAENSKNSFQHYVGEIYGGGVVFYVYRDQLGLEHGLVVSLTEQSSNVTYGCPNQTVNASSTWNGFANSNAIVSSCGTNTAAGVCRNYTYQNFNDWYLPSVNEMELLYINKFSVNQSLSTLIGAQELDVSGNLYWTSTQPLHYDWVGSVTDSIAKNALVYYPPFSGASHPDIYLKSTDFIHARAIRKF